ncbi:MAG: mercuric transporter MerT family protein [Burkholderiales bacterium]
MRYWTASTSLLAGAFAALGASACCAGPLLLVVLGIGGAWTTHLAALEVYQPYFAVATLACFGYAYYRLYHKTADCAPGDTCAVPTVRFRQRLVFWLVAAAALALIGLPIYAPLFY